MIEKGPTSTAPVKKGSIRKSFLTHSSGLISSHIRFRRAALGTAEASTELGCFQQSGGLANLHSNLWWQSAASTQREIFLRKRAHFSVELFTWGRCSEESEVAFFEGPLLREKFNCKRVISEEQFDRSCTPIAP